MIRQEDEYEKDSEPDIDDLHAAFRLSGESGFRGRSGDRSGSRCGSERVSSCAGRTRRGARSEEGGEACGSAGP